MEDIVEAIRTEKTRMLENAVKMLSIPAYLFRGEEPRLTEEDALHAAIDLSPEDWTRRLILADYYEENGNDREARYYRFTAKNKKRPSGPGTRWNKQDNYRDFKGWRWWSDGPCDKYSWISEKHNEPKDLLFPSARFSTRREAETAFRLYLEEVNYEIELPLSEDG